jgi:hypothetical protein
MRTVSNSQALMFAALSSEEGKDLQTTTLSGWFGAQQLGQARAMITDAVRSAKGVVTHTVGEAVLSSFPDAPAAVKAALDVQRRLATLDATKLRIQVRAGLSFGPVRVIAGKVSGDAVSAAGALLETAQPGEILVDQAVKEALGKFDYVKLLPHAPVQGKASYRVTAAGAAAPDHSATQVIQPRPDFAPPPKPAAPPPPAPRPQAPPPPPPPPPTPVAAPAPAPAPAPAAAPRALVLRYGDAERRFSATDGEVTLGRALENHINIPVAHVSRRHAKIVWEGDTPVLVNLSQNGSCVSFDGDGRQIPCDSRMELRGSGGVALAPRFGESPTNADVVYFRIG